jgi:hypothetical protein
LKIRAPGAEIKGKQKVASDVFATSPFSNYVG